MRIDLHAHTTASDGSLEPAALVALAAASGVGTLAVTDHDTVDGVAEALAAARGTRLRVVCGIELTVRVPVGQLHLLGYFPEPAPSPLVDRLGDLARRREDRARRIVDRLHELGAPVDWKEVATRAAGTVGRPHVADALVAVGHAADRDDAFARFLADDGPAYVPSDGLEPEEAVMLVRASGGAPCLAHPGTLRLAPAALDRMVERLTRAGLIGIEVHRPDHGADARRQYRRLADRFGLVPTGGSDFHAEGRSFPLGDTGAPRLPAETLDRLLARAKAAPPSATVRAR